ncbi:MAG: LON peptidase substrate-binding domain-containing protein [Wenzhouxiangella sp.]
MSSTLPLFPLETVLFPGARLPLRLFESRYIDMVRECLRNETGFGVVWRMDLTPEQSGGHARVGTEAIISDFSTHDDGLLGIECEGRRRFIVRATRARDNGLLVADVDWLVDEPAEAVRPEHAALQTLLREIQQFRELAGLTDADADDAVSLSFGLAAILKIDLPRSQNLLELTRADQRLDALARIVESAAPSDSDDPA